jgi:hypothetical protein
MRKAGMAFAIFLVVVAGLAAVGVITEGDKEPVPPARSAAAKTSSGAPANR